METLEGCLALFWIVILAAGGTFKLGEWIWKRLIFPCRHWPVVIRTDGSVECPQCHKTLKKANPKWR